MEVEIASAGKGSLCRMSDCRPSADMSISNRREEDNVEVGGQGVVLPAIYSIMVSTLILIFLGILLIRTIPVATLNYCSVETGAGICPEGNVCCATGLNGTSACVTVPAAHHEGISRCCFDDGTGISGCGPGYSCASKVKNGERKLYCQLIDDDSEKHIQPAKVLPRYDLCSLPRTVLERVHTLQVDSGLGSDLPQLAYYSTMGPLDTSDNLFQSQQRRVRVAIIVIHGSDRNADDYICCASSAMQKIVGKDLVIILAPRFLAVEDGPVNVTNSSVDLLRWNETHPIPHTWRYGADAIDADISSYDAVDAMVAHLTREQFPAVERIVIAGHSAGGQFTQRWAMTSMLIDSSRVPIRVVVANPRSFCYLDGRRFTNGTLQLPTDEAIDACPGYNSWEWGLDAGGELPTPYKDRALRQVGGAVLMATRYAQRHVYYLAGALDVLPVHASCEDDVFQGSNRRERSRLFFESLNAKYASHKHRRLVVSDVPHDHCLIFQSGAFRDAVGDLQAPPSLSTW